MVPGRPPPSPAVLTHARPSPTVPGRPHPSPAVLNSPRPSSPIPGRPDSSPAVPSRPSPLSCTNMSHPVGPAVLPKDGRPALRVDGTDYSQPSRPVRGCWQSPREAPPGPRTVGNTDHIPRSDFFLLDPGSMQGQSLWGTSALKLQACGPPYQALNHSH